MDQFSRKINTRIQAQHGKLNKKINKRKKNEKKLEILKS